MLVAALESDFCRSTAADGIRLVRAAAIPYLIEKVRSPEPSHAEETPSSLRHRRAALALLAEDELDFKHWGVSSELRMKLALDVGRLLFEILIQGSNDLQIIGRER